jgi:hypothetical protein
MTKGQRNVWQGMLRRGFTDTQLIAEMQRILNSVHRSTQDNELIPLLRAELDHRDLLR